jgi:hypothetical protein
MIDHLYAQGIALPVCANVNREPPQRGCGLAPSRIGSRV